MAGRIPVTPPKERKNINGSVPSKVDRDGHFTIIDIDRERHTVSLDVGGCPVTLICSPQNNPKPYQRVKAILLDMLAGTTPQN